MKKLLLFSCVALFLSFVPVRSSSDVLSKKERHYAGRLLKDTENDVLNKIKGLSEAQLTFKPAPDRWSVEECMKHIAASEQELWQMVSGTMQQSANPDKRSEIKVTDEQVVTMVESREKKMKTIDQLKPENTPFKSMEDAVTSFKENRERLIMYVHTTQDDLRDHCTTVPFGMADCYQIILLIGAHSNRHAQQMVEVMADPNFPKN